MIQSKKIFAVFFIAVFLVSLSLLLVEDVPEISVIANRIVVDANYGKPPGTPGGKPDKPDKPNDGGGKPGDYSLLGVKWETLSLTLIAEDSWIEAATETSAAEWDSYTSASLVNEVVVKSGITIFDEIQSEIPDLDNELVWANLDSGTIAVCYTWYSGGEIIQFDIAFNTDFDWGNGESDKMDLQNIVTHEIGHGFGLADIYKRKLNYLTMYGYSFIGDLEKRTLAQGDIDGIQALYGALP